MIIITGSIVARPETFDHLRKASLAHVARSRTEDGCDLHSVHVDVENPLRLVFIEHWRDRAAVLKHFEDSDARTFVAEARRLSATAPQIELYESSILSVKELST